MFSEYYPFDEQNLKNLAKYHPFVKKEVALTRSLGLFEVTVAGVGIILGAGIYALIGLATATTGNALWLAFLVAAVLSAFTGLSYASLSTRFSNDGGEYDYASRAFNKTTAKIVGLMVIATGFISAATVALGFGNYLQAIIGGNTILLAFIILIICTLVNLKGIKESSLFNIICTVIELAGLIFIVGFGFKYLGNVNYLAMTQGFHGVFQAAALVFFAYMGFESIVKLSEETKDPHKTIPRALILSVIISAVIYILVAFIAVSVLPWQELYASKAPLATVAAALVGSRAFLALAIIALFSTANTVLVSLVTTSRLIYGMAKERALPQFLRYIHPTTKTPWIAIIILSAVTGLFILIDNLGFVANLNDIFLFITFGIVNLANVVLTYRQPIKRGFTTPGNIGKYSTISILGFLVSIFMLYYALNNVF